MAGFYRLSDTCQIARLDEIYEAVFGRRGDGVFVEVGAFDGERYSNTSCLADVGWRGLYIEPVPLHAQICRDRHRRNPAVSVVECAIGPAAGRATIHVAQLFSSLHADVVETSRELYKKLGPDMAQMPIDELFTGETVEVDVRRLDDVMTGNAIAPGFDVLVVDVEGHEPAVFESFDLARWAPRLIIVELLDLHPQYGAGAKGIAGLRGRILAAGYEHRHVDEVNTIFERAD